MSKRKPVPGLSQTRNKNLACAVCGIPFLRDRFELWVIGLHMELWHDTEEIKLITAEKNTRLNVPEPVDMATSQEILATLTKVQEAVLEARQVTAELHSGIKDYKHTVKTNTADIKALILQVVEDHIHNLEIDVKEEMRAKISLVIDDISSELHKRLSL